MHNVQRGVAMCMWQGGVHERKKNSGRNEDVRNGVLHMVKILCV